MKNLFFIFICLVSVLSLEFIKPLSKLDHELIYKDKEMPIPVRVKDLLKRMTLEEKIMQLSQYAFGLNNNPNNIEKEKRSLNPNVGSLIYFDDDPELRNSIQKRAINETRLGIPILFGFDIIHGCKTLYPIPLAVGCSFDTSLAKRASEMAAREAFFSGIDWTFSPMVNISHDPRWGRVAEGYGEDPYTNSMFAMASVKGYQGEGDTIDSLHIAACLKHYVAYGLSLGGRDYTATDVSRQALWETYFPAFEAGVKAGVKTVMSSFNDVNGIPATANKYLLTNILRNKWSFEGFVVSDWNAISQLIIQGVAKDEREAAQKALVAGTDLDMLDGYYERNLKDLLKDHKISIKQIDDAVSRILTVKFQLGLFDNPYTPVIPKYQRYLRPQDKDVAAKLAEESMVLLKNDNHALPVSSKDRSIAIIGPMVKDSFNLMGAWRGYANVSDVQSIYTAIHKEFKSKMKINYAQGSDFEKKDKEDFSKALKVAAKSDKVILFLGEKNSWSGENASRSTIALPKNQEDLVKTISKTGKPIILVLTNGRPLALSKVEPYADAILEAWQPGTFGAEAIAGILSGRINPSGKLAITFPRTTGQIPLFYNMKPSSRPQYGIYQDIGSNEPLYWFGHGLSYSSLSYGRIHLSDSIIDKNQHLLARVEVTNNSNRDAKEIALWFISDPVATISRPRKELNHFERKTIRAGETVTYKFEIIPEKDLSYPDKNGNKVLESGVFYLSIGNRKVKFELI